MRIFIVVFLKTILASNIYTSHKGYDFLSKIPQYASAESVESTNSDDNFQKRNAQKALLLKRCSPLLKGEKIVLIVWFRLASKIIISAKNNQIWDQRDLDQKDENFRKVEVPFFKDRSNIHDEYIVTIDNHSRKCFFPSKTKWEVVIDGNLFRYQEQTDSL